MKNRLLEQNPTSRLTDGVNHTFKAYLRRLNNLGGNNRSVLLLKLSGDQLVDIHQLGYLHGQKAFEIIATLISGKKKKICPVLDSRMEAANEASTRLKRLQRADKFIHEERGSNDLHVGWPFLRGKFSDGTWVRAPLLYFPVEIIQDDRDWILQLRKDAGITFNKSFFLSYAHFNQVKLDEELIETSFEDFDTDSTVFRTQLYQLVKDRLEINFNPDIFTDTLTPFRGYKKDEFEELHRNGEIKLFPEAVLGIFPQANSQLVPDYLQMIEENSIESMEQFFLKRNSTVEGVNIRDSREVNLAVKEEKVYAPFALDEWQEHALKSTKLGQSLVVQGPPGTGKSQLIANLIGDCIASGKKVLLVCQKRVALDVVYERLKSINLTDFVGLVHDFRNDRKEIYEKIALQIGKLDEYQARNRSIDIIQTERRFFHICRTIDRITEELEEFRKALVDDSECGLCIKELYLTSDLKASRINLHQEYQHFHFDSLNVFLRKLNAYVSYAKTVEVEEYPWRNRKSFANHQLSDQHEMAKIIKEVSTTQQKLGLQLERLIGNRLNLEDAESLLDRKEQANEMVSLLADERVYTGFVALVKEDDEETSLLWLQNMERVCLNCFAEPGVESSLKDDQIGRCQLALQQRMAARRSLIRLIRWELFSENRFFLKRVLIANGLKYNKAGLKTLEQRLDNRLNLQHHVTALREKKWLGDIPSLFDGRNFKRWFEKQQLAIRAKLLFSSLREMSRSINPEGLSREDFIRLIWNVFDELQKLPDQKSRWLVYLTPYQVNQLIHSPDSTSAFVELLSRDFDSLCEFDKIKDSLTSYELEIITRMFDELQDWSSEKFDALFQNSLRLVWIEHIEMKYPVLRWVSTLKMDQSEQEFFQAIAEKQKISTEILLLRAREKVYEQLEFNRLNNRITYRDMHHQVTKKKKIWPVRKLIQEFHEELFNLLPCWMASPESVSALFPMNEMFDLVIFDEASQCFAERGLPAMFRGKQVVIAGDSQQLKPFDLYQVRWEEETDSADLELDSLLALSSRYLPTVHLQGHYRSRSAELIDFSNRNFYNGTLNLLPAREDFNRREPSISYVKVNGVWKDQTNAVEADTVVQCVCDLIHNHPDKEIGVVTFNAPQQALIMDQLEAQMAKRGTSLPASLMVKNIENVQGDEKDIIIFSTGYAPDKSGKMNMQFGSLNVAGGENRLNVAITRAREKIIVISSIGPEDLKLQGVRNEGPKLLKQYLEFAEAVSSGRFKTGVNVQKKQSPSWYLSSKLQKWGHREIKNAQFAEQALSFCDLVIMLNQEAAGIIQTDDSAFSTALTSKGPCAYLPSLLQAKGWTYRKVYSRNWWADREKVENEIKKFAHTFTSQYETRPTE